MQWPEITALVDLGHRAKTLPSLPPGAPGYLFRNSLARVIIALIKISTIARTLLLCFVVLPAAAQIPAPAKLDVLIADSHGQAISGVLVELSSALRVVKTGETDALGHTSFAGLEPGSYALKAQKAGFETLEKQLEVAQPGLTAELTMVPPMARSESIEVRGTVMEVEENTSAPNRFPPKDAKELPSRPATVADALPMIPGVVREPGGGLILSASPEHRSALIVNSADVTDPATGQFGLTVPIDSVEVLNVYQTAYLAEYGRFTAGLVSVETRRGGDKWKWELNDPLPEFRIRSYHLRGLKTATPRLNFEGPLIANKLFVSEGFEYEIQKTAVYTLPFPFNQKKQEGVNSFSQLDWVASPTHLVTATVHLAPQRIDSLNMDYFNPQPTTPDSTARNYTGTAFDRFALWHGLLENQFSVTRFDGSVWGRGTDDLVIGPAGTGGSFFAEQSRYAARISGTSSYAFAPVERWGTHQFKVGGNLRQQRTFRGYRGAAHRHCRSGGPPAVAHRLSAREKLRNLRSGEVILWAGPLDHFTSAGRRPGGAHRIAADFGGFSRRSARRVRLDAVQQRQDHDPRRIRPVLRSRAAQRVRVQPLPKPAGNVLRCRRGDVSAARSFM